MSATSRSLPLCAAVFAAALLSSTAAQAQIDGQDVFERLKAQVALQGARLDASQVQTEGNNVLLTGLSAQFPPGTGTLPLGNQVLRNVSVTEDGSYLVDRIEIDPIQRTVDDLTVDFAGGTIENYLIAGPDVTDPIVLTGTFTAMDGGALSIGDADGTIFSMEGFDVTVSPYRPGEIMTFTTNVDNLAGDMTRLPDENARNTMSALGYNELRADMVSSGSWDPANGQLIAENAVNVVDAGNLSVNFDIAGYTPELVATMQHLQAQTAQDGDDAVLKGQLAVLEQLKINGLSVQLDDASVTNRVLDFVASQQGLDRASVAAMAKGVVPLAMVQLGNPTFAATVSAAVSAFLDNPQNLKIEAKPAAPVSGAELTATMAENPQGLIDLLGIVVIANQ